MTLDPAAIEVVRHPRARTTRLALDPMTGRVRLTLPPRAPLNRALRWAAGQGEWLAAERARLPRPRPFVDGAPVPFGDDELTIAWSAEGPRTARRDGDRLVVGGPAEALARRVTAWLRREALRVLSEETAEFAARAGVTVASVAIGDPRRRWGSCASHGAIRYSWRLVCAPVTVRRATVAHEVAHRVHMNHGPAFHAFVAELLGAAPDPSRAWLRRHGAALHWLGRDS